ncbi:MAG: hypothetical protein ACLT5P_05055 [Flavonifractor plautii]
MNMRKQRCMGVALLVVSAVIWLLASTGETVEERDGTALLLTFPLDLPAGEQDLRLGRCGLQVPGPGHRGSGNQLRR